MARKVRWLLVGPGDIAEKRVAPALAGARNSELLGVVYHRRRERAVSLARRYGARQLFSDLNEALRSSEADAVYLATPVDLHAPQAVAAMESGRHVLVEKPLGLSAADCAPMLLTAERTGLTAGCAYYRRCYPRFRHALQMLAGGEFGRVVLVRMTYYGWFDPEPSDPKRWRLERRRSGGGPLADMGSHMLDLMIGLFGLPQEVFARAEALAHPWEVEDTFSALMALPDGAHAVACFGWNSRTWRHEFEVVGTEANLYWCPYDTGTVRKGVGRETLELDLPNAENVHLPLVQDFVGAVLEGRPPVCPLTEAVKTNTLMDALYSSARQGCRVQVNR